MENSSQKLKLHSCFNNLCNSIAIHEINRFSIPIEDLLRKANKKIPFIKYLFFHKRRVPLFKFLFNLKLIVFDITYCDKKKKN